MNHLIVCREYPPTPGGGIGTYALHVARLFAEAGDNVHVLGQTWSGAQSPMESSVEGRLVVHRVPFERPALFRKRGLRNGGSNDSGVRGLFSSRYYPEAFSWKIAPMIESLVESFGIDLIEAPEYEGPLHHYLRRRSRGMGPEEQPPCLVHLHSATEDIARHNGWDVNDPFIRRAREVENHSIESADMLLAPSRFLAEQTEHRFGFSEGSISVIPYPLGDVAFIERTREVWARGSVLFLGRLEGRKGILEWIQAAVRVAESFPGVSFQFLGENVLGRDWRTGSHVVDQLIPGNLRHRFVFRPPVERHQVQRVLAETKIVVVPSRWDNFPNACMEALASGVPVIATRMGGMAEMIAEGETGWLASRADVSELASTLRQALNTPTDRLAEMGNLASKSIRTMCGASETVEKHRLLREEVVSSGASRSRSQVAEPGVAGDAASMGQSRRAFLPGTMLRRFAEGPLATLAFVSAAINRRVRRFIAGY